MLFYVSVRLFEESDPAEVPTNGRRVVAGGSLGKVAIFSGNAFLTYGSGFPLRGLLLGMSVLGFLFLSGLSWK